MCCDLLDLCFGRRDARPVCRNVDLVVAMTLLTVVFDGWIWEVDLLCLYPSWVVYFCDSRVLARYADFGLRIARVVLFQMYCGLGGLDWRTPWNVLPYGCASPDR